jgi:hypothetical protein
LAKIIINKDGSKLYNNTETYKYIDTDDGFLFKQNVGATTYDLLGYIGREKTVTLPLDIEGNTYNITSLVGI